MGDIIIGGSYLNRIKNRLVEMIFVYFFLTNVQYLYLNTYRPEKIQQKKDFFTNFKENLTRDSKVYINLTGNSLYENRTRDKHCNPMTNSAFDESKQSRYYTDMTSLINFIINQYKAIGVSGEELSEKIIILPTLPRFIFTCCQNQTHIRQDHKLTQDEINTQQIKIQKEFTIKGVKIVNVISIKHLLNYFITRLKLKDIFVNDMDLIKKLTKKNFEFSFKNLCTNKKAQRIILKYILDGNDNGLHLKREYNHIWADYLFRLTQKDFNPHQTATQHLKKLYDDNKN